MNVIKQYIDRGVHQQKIIQTSQSSFCIWSLSRKCLVGENGIEPLEIIENQLTYKNNRIISLQIRTELTNDLVKEINESDGIIVTDALYEHPERFRFGFIPNENGIRI
jgi:hypothetical protein